MLDGTILNYFNIIGEFGYLKMVVTLLLQTMNDQYLHIFDHPVCKSPIFLEIQNIEYARYAFQINKSYTSLCKAFIAVNSMTLICWPVRGNIMTTSTKMLNHWKTKYYLSCHLRISLLEGLGLS